MFVCEWFLHFFSFLLPLFFQNRCKEKIADRSTQNFILLFQKRKYVPEKNYITPYIFSALSKTRFRISNTRCISKKKSAKKHFFFLPGVIVLCILFMKLSATNNNNKQKKKDVFLFKNHIQDILHLRVHQVFFSYKQMVLWKQILPSLMNLLLHCRISSSIGIVPL
jgi:hypothetical protein